MGVSFGMVIGNISGSVADQSCFRASGAASQEDRSYGRRAYGSSVVVVGWRIIGIGGRIRVGIAICHNRNRHSIVVS